MANNRLRQVLTEGANTKALRGLMIGLAALVVLAVSGYGTVIYIQLMGKVFPTGPLLMACYMGAAANVLLMLVLLVGKFVWFRPGAHEVASWIVTGVELLVCILNMMLAYQLASGQALTSIMQAWYYLAPVSPVFSMVGAITLIMTSTELRKRHRDLEMQEQKDQSEREFELAMHRAEMDVKHQYLGFVTTKLTAELNAPERQVEMADHAALMVSEVLSGISGLQSVPRLRGPHLPNEKTIEQGSAASGTGSASRSQSGQLADDDWLSRVNARIEQERASRLASAASVSDENEQGTQGAALEQRISQLLADGALRDEDLLRVERWFGLSSYYDKNQRNDLALADRVHRVVDEVQRRGYSSEQVEGFVRQMAGQRGDVNDAKKK